MNKRKAIIIAIQSNPVELSDCEALSSGMKRAVFDTEICKLSDLAKDDNYLKRNWGEYSSVVFTPCLNGLWISKKNNKECLKHIFNNSKESALSLLICDTTLSIDVNVWDKDEDSSQKEAVFASKPLKVIGSFDKAITEDEEAMKVLHRVYFRKLHEDSKLYPIEWLSFYIYDLEDKIKEKIKLSKEIESEVYPNGLPEIDGFYYGISKKKVAKELEEMGFGNSEKDAVFGGISKNFPESKYPNLLRFGENPRKVTPEYWIPLAQKAKKLYIPYDPVKGDYQFTKRFLESYLLNPDGLYISDKINSNIKAFFTKEKWYEEAKNSERELSELFPD